MERALKLLALTAVVWSPAAVLLASATVEAIISRIRQARRQARRRARAGDYVLYSRMWRR